MKVSCTAMVMLPLVAIMLLSSCRKEKININKNLDIEAYQRFSVPQYRLDARHIRNYLQRLTRNDRDSMLPDQYTKRYYLDKKDFLWINRCGIDAAQIRSLVDCADIIVQMGFDTEKFRVGQIIEDLRRIENLSFDSAHNNINHVYARLEYNLTKFYLRYTYGQRFGFVNPIYLYNRIDVRDSTDGNVIYRQLFALKMERPGPYFAELAMNKIRKDSLTYFLEAVQPVSPLYARLLKRLHQADVGRYEKAKILCNIERCRWRLKDYPQRYKKYVLVNIPSFKLCAVDGDSVLEMRVGCGTFETKTPLLYSQIKRMDINPQWIIPRSIVKKSIIKHVGDKNYFESRGYLIKNIHTGEEIDLDKASLGMLENGEFAVIQRGGKGNSLGRIVFRFDNDFSVYLHDTPSRDFFSREDRGVSHGCIRVQKPFELAKFILGNANDELIRKIAYSIQADISIHRDDKNKSLPIDTLNRKLLIRTCYVKPKVPLFIIYFTIYPDKNGVLTFYDDVYGYDQVIYRQLKNYM